MINEQPPAIASCSIYRGFPYVLDILCTLLISALNKFMGRIQGEVASIKQIAACMTPTRTPVAAEEWDSEAPST